MEGLVPLMCVEVRGATGLWLIGFSSQQSASKASFFFSCFSIRQISSFNSIIRFDELSDSVAPSHDG